jgi:hypothetical protein
MRALFVLFLLPTAIGLLSLSLLRSVKRASFVATLGTPLLIYCFVKLTDPGDPWNGLATLLVSPLVIAVAVITVFVCAGCLRAPKQRH